MTNIRVAIEHGHLTIVSFSHYKWQFSMAMSTFTRGYQFLTVKSPAAAACELLEAASAAAGKDSALVAGPGCDFPCVARQVSKISPGNEDLFGGLLGFYGDLMIMKWRSNGVFK